jgi:hypothetical protein
VGMLRVHHLAVVSIVPFALAACSSGSAVLSRQPVSNDQTSTLDRQLFGAWDYENKDGSHGLVWIGKKKGTQKTFELVKYNVDRDLTVETVRTSMFTRGGHDKYASIEVNEYKNEKAERRWLIVKYCLIDATTLQLFYFKDRQFRNAVRKGELKGKIEPFDSRRPIRKQQNDENDGHIVLNDTSEAVVGFVGRTGDSCFEEKPIILRKLRMMGE